MLEARHGPMEARRLPGDGDSGARARAGRCQAARKARSHTRVRAHDPQPRTHTRPYAGACTGACSLARAQTGRHACARTHAGAPARKRTRAQVPARQAALQLRRVRRQTNKQTNTPMRADTPTNRPNERAMAQTPAAFAAMNPLGIAMVATGVGRAFVPGSRYRPGFRRPVDLRAQEAQGPVQGVPRYPSVPPQYPSTSTVSQYSHATLIVPPQ